jgi:hypothetical protein
MAAAPSIGAARRACGAGRPARTGARALPTKSRAVEFPTDLARTRAAYQLIGKRDGA